MSKNFLFVLVLSFQCMSAAFADSYTNVSMANTYNSIEAFSCRSRCAIKGPIMELDNFIYDIDVRTKDPKQIFETLEQYQKEKVKCLAEAKDLEWVVRDEFCVFEDHFTIHPDAKINNCHAQCQLGEKVTTFVESASAGPEYPDYWYGSSPTIELLGKLKVFSDQCIEAGGVLNARDGEEGNTYECN